MVVSYKRIAVCYSVIVIMLFICVLRVYAISTSETYLEAAEGVNSRKIVLSRDRGTVFDCNMKRLTNEREKNFAVIFDNPKGIASLYKIFHTDEIAEITDEIRKNGFAVRAVSRNFDTEGIYCYKALEHVNDNTLAKHIIGYTDAENNGACGIEQSFNELLKRENETSVTFAIDGRGRVINGEKPTLHRDYSGENDGVMLTINKDIQRIAEQQALEIECGAVVVTEIESGKIRAMVSRPDFALSRLGEALESEDSPLINRAICNYNLGSIFKPCVAAAGLDAGVVTDVNCVGYTNVDGLNFTCYNLAGHGEMHLFDALKFSCNCYFYEYIQLIGGEKVINTAKSFGAENSIRLADSIVCPKGSIGDDETLIYSRRGLANVSVGQGAMLISPLVINNLYMAIANGGSYNTPSLVEGIIENGKLTEKFTLPAKVKVMKPSTADTLKQALATVLDEDGTGYSAKPSLTTAAGKTGTAQTGRIKNGKKVINSWFCGFFPFDNPKYAVTVLSENAKNGCGSVFAGIADGITDLEQTNN